MGAGLRKQCCGGRDTDAKDLAKSQLEAQSWNFLSGEGGRDDLAQFDEAREAQDITALLNLLDSQQPLTRKDTQIHPWATPPETVGALAAFQLASMASKDGNEAIKTALREAGAIPKFVKYLSSEEEDRKHSAVVALSFLAVENDENCQAMYSAGALPSLVECLKHPPDGLKGASADTARGIYVLDPLYRQTFAASGGIKPLVDLLELPTGNYDPNSLFNQSEAIYHIEDLILDNGVIIPKLMADVKECGAVKLLEALAKVDGNPSLHEDAKALLGRLGG